MGFLFCPPDCSKRVSGCHSTCKDYEARKKEYDRLKVIADKDREARCYAAEMNRINKDRITKRRHLQGK